MTTEQQVQHTPGPWRWHFSGTGGRYALLAGDEYAPTWVETGGPPRDDLSPDQMLIQAAPDLLAALEWTMEMLESTHYKCNVDDEEADEDCELEAEAEHEAIRAGRAASLKARGKA